MSEPTKAVFLSYASQDAEAAGRICESLRQAGVEVWFDQNELVGGDAWDQKIRGQIKACALFMPIVSAASQARREGYFRLEWKLAAQRTQTIADGTPFLLPVVIDATRDAEALVPEEFRSVQWTRLADGEATPAFVARVRKLLGGEVVAQAASRPVVERLSVPRGAESRSATAPEAGWKPALPQSASRAPLVLGAIAIVAIGAAALVWLRRPAAESRATLRPEAAATSSNAPAPALPADKSIAVLPFENRSEEKANAYFTDGIHEDILTDLAHIRELRVVSRTSVMEYRATTKKIPQIARELNVAFVLEGSVQRAGNMVHITGQLIRAATDEHLWAKNYDRELTAANIFAIQSELAQAIAGELQAAISPQEKNLLGQAPTENLEAYDLYLKARAERRNTDPTTSSVAPRLRQENFLQAAVALDAGFAAAWGELAVMHADAYFFLDDHTDRRLAKAKAAMDTALRLAPEAPDVIHCLGDYYFHAHRDYARAIAEYEKLLVRQPNDPTTYSAIGYVQRREGRWSEALANLRKASQLDPGEFNSASNLATTLEAARRYDELGSQRRRLVELRPGNLQENSRLALVPFRATGSTREMDEFLAGLKSEVADSPEGLALRRRWADARGNLAEVIRLDRLSQADGVDAVIALLAHHESAVKERAELENATARLRSKVADDPTDPERWARMARNAAGLGHAEEALRDARKAVELLPESLDTFAGPGLSNTLAFVYAWTGDKDRAIAEYARLLRTPRGAPSVYDMKHRAEYFPLQGDPRFEALLSDPKNNAPLF